MIAIRFTYAQVISQYLKDWDEANEIYKSVIQQEHSNSFIFTNTLRI